jgi:hypothetical protein
MKNLKIPKYDHKVQGAALPANLNYRFQLTYESWNWSRPG